MVLEIDLYEFEMEHLGESQYTESTKAKIPYCEPTETGTMPTFWRGFWPYAGGPVSQIVYSDYNL